MPLEGGSRLSDEMLPSSPPVPPSEAWDLAAFRAASASSNFPFQAGQVRWRSQQPTQQGAASAPPWTSSESEIPRKASMSTPNGRILPCLSAGRSRSRPLSSLRCLDMLEYPL